MRLSLPLLGCILLAACDDGTRGLNAPTEPARPIQGPAAEAPPADTPPVARGMLPARGPASFVGRWALEAEWCADPRGDRVPITITTSRFDGYENRCAITSIDETDQAYVAHLSCESEGLHSQERVRLAATDKTLDVTWLDRSDRPVRLLRCTTLAD
jgi:hypothetical protein